MIHSTNAIPLAASSVDPEELGQHQNRRDLHASADARNLEMLPKQTNPSRMTTSVTPSSWVAGNARNTQPKDAAMTHHSTTV